MLEQAAGPSVAEEAVLLVGERQFRPNRRRVMRKSVPERLASSSQRSPVSLGVRLG